MLAIEKKKGNIIARNLIIQEYLPLVARIVKAYFEECGGKRTIHKLIKIGNIGLLTGVEKYDYEKDGDLFKFLSWWILQALECFTIDDDKYVELYIAKQMKEISYKKMRIKRRTFAILLAIAVIVCSASFIPKPVKRTITVTKAWIDWGDDKTYTRSTERILVEDELSCDGEVKSITYTGDLIIIYFSSDSGFNYLMKGANSINGKMPSIFIDIENGPTSGTGTLKIETKSGKRVTRNLELSGDKVYVSAEGGKFYD